MSSFLRHIKGQRSIYVSLMVASLFVLWPRHLNNAIIIEYSAEEKTISKPIINKIVMSPFANKSKVIFMEVQSLEEKSIQLCHDLLDCPALSIKTEVIINRCTFIKQNLERLKAQTKKEDSSADLAVKYVHEKTHSILRTANQLQLYIDYEIGHMFDGHVKVKNSLHVVIVMAENILEKWTYPWIENHFKNLKKKLVTDIYKIQYLKNCKEKDKTLICSFLSKSTGLGTRIEKLAYCQNVGLETGRRVIVADPEREFFTKPFFKNFWSICRVQDIKRYALDWPLWKGEMNSSKPVLRINGQKQIPMIPQGIEPYLENSIFQPNNAWAWYVGILQLFAMQFADSYKEYFDLRAKSVGLTLPYDGFKKNTEPRKNIIAGIQVRRGDKDRAIPHQPLSAYMQPVENYFLKLEMKMGQRIDRRVFIATDDKSVIEEITKGYPLYTVYGNTSAAANANLPNHNLFGPNTTEDILTDVLLLAAVDFLVCTLSSHVGRIIYALRSALDMRAQDTTLSLDRGYRMDGWKVASFVINEDHNVPGELSLSKGDIIHTGTLKAALDAFHNEAGTNGPYPTNGMGFAFDRTPGTPGGWYPKAIARRYYPWMDEPRI